MIKIKQTLILICALLLTISGKTFAQAPALTIKATGTLSQKLLGARTFSAATVDTSLQSISTMNSITGYTLEVVAKATSVGAGRGLDIEARNAAMKGFRISLDSNTLKRSDTITSITNYKSSLTKLISHTIRIAVKNDTANVYVNGTYITRRVCSTIKDVSGNAETDTVFNASQGTNLISNWSGSGATGTTSKPSDFGWGFSYTNLFDVANSVVAGTSRFLDVTSSSNPHTFLNTGGNFTGRVMLIRWDGGGSYQTAVYSLPVTLAANTLYNFSWLYGFNSGGTAPYNITVGVGTTSSTSSRFAQKTFTSSSTAKALQYGAFSFTSTAAGTYYITITSSNNTLFSIAQLSLNTLTPTPRFIIGKNYATGTVNMSVDSVYYDNSGAYAPVANSWKGGTAGNTTAWYTNTNWSYNVTPGFTDDVIIPVSNNKANLNGNFTLGAANTLTINGTGALQINAGFALVINGSADFGNKSVIVVSNSTKSAAIINNGTLTNASNVTLQQWVTGQRGYRVLSNPFSTALIPSTIGTANSITVTGSNDVKIYDGINNNWAGSVSSIPANSPYSVFIRGLASEVTGLNYSGGPTAFAYNVTGTLNSSPVTIGQNNTTANDWTISGNPFAAPVYTSALTGGISGIPYYVYSMAQNSTGVRVKAGGWVAASSNSSTTTRIPMMGVVAYQAGTSAPATFNVSTSAIDTLSAHSIQTSLFGVTNATTQLELQINKDGNYQDKLFVRLNGNSTEMGNERMDLPKWNNEVTNIYTITPDKVRLAVDARRVLDNNIPIGVLAPAGSYSLTVASNNLPNATDIYLFDKLLKTQTLMIAGTNYKFDITTDNVTKGENRFEIGVLKKSITESTLTDGLTVKTVGNVINNEAKIEVKGAKGTIDIVVLDINGKIISRTTSKKELNTLKLDSSTGMYFIKVTDGFTISVVKVVKM